MKRLFDIIFSLIGLILLFPLFFLIAITIVLDSSGGIFYRQKRVGLNGKDFLLFKFRSMHSDSDKKGLLTVGAKDNRVTKVGYFLRKFKLDELPQLLNVFLGDMSLVGPRPEVRKYVDQYTAEQRKVLTVKPGITDYASIEYSNESEILAGVSNPEEVYIQKIMPAKLELNMKYIKETGIFTDLRIILATIGKILKRK